MILNLNDPNDADDPIDPNGPNDPNGANDPNNPNDLNGANDPKDPNDDPKGEQSGGRGHWCSARLHIGQCQYQWGEVRGEDGEMCCFPCSSVGITKGEVSPINGLSTVDSPSINGEKLEVKLEKDCVVCICCSLF